MGGWAVTYAVLAAVLAAYPPTRLAAQVPDTAPAPAPAVVPADTTHRVGAMGAFWRSLVLPGWGQAVTRRPVTGALFASWEGVTVMMTLKAQSELHYLRASGSGSVGAKRQEVQDWIVLWVFNHLFSGAEAFVSAHLEDFPKDLKVRAAPGVVGVSLPLR